MNYTREPIIETVITPRDGCTLVVRNSKGGNQEEYFVDAIEVVSFGASLFFRSQERPKSFLVPVSDYEVLELKETRMVLKNVGSDRSIKIGGGKEAPVRQKDEVVADAALAESRPAPATDARSQGGKRDNKRRRSRRGRERNDLPQEPVVTAEQNHGDQGASAESHEPPEGLPRGEESVQGDSEIEAKAPSFISKLFPPPTTLIRDTISRYKPQEPLPADEPVNDQEIEKVEEPEEDTEE